LAPSGRTAFEELFRTHEARIHASIRRKLGRTLRRRIESGDVLNIVFMAALRLVGEGKADGNMSGKAFLVWISRVVDYQLLYLVRREVKTWQRSLLKEVRLGSDGDGAGWPAKAKTPSEELSELERVQRLEGAMKRLTPREREAVELVYFQRLKVADAAARMGKTANATSVLLRRAIVKLGGILKLRSAEP
jgi:RNA polymerase sigma factor (sigma-70 family)